jgi:predicted ATPase
LSLKQVLEDFKHIELTEDEMDEAILAAKRKKESILNQRAIEQREAENRRLLTGTRWSYDQTKSYMQFRANTVFEGQFKIDQHNVQIFELLCYYFSEDERFVGLAEDAGISNPSLEKGIYIAGNFGVGKTWLLKLFSRNQRQVFAIQNAKEIADKFEVEGESSIEQFVNCPKLPVNDVSNFYHKSMGLCIDDMGTEDIKNHYGNKKNVVGDLIELRYSKKNTGTLLHATSNLTGDQLKTFYGGRVASRMREIMNVIELTGQDRRK